MSDDDQQASELAAILDCFTEVDLQVLSNVGPTTVEAWRKRGTGPNYVRFGNRYLYPREALRIYINDRVHVRRPTAKGAL